MRLSFPAANTLRKHALRLSACPCDSLCASGGRFTAPLLCVRLVAFCAEKQTTAHVRRRLFVFPRCVYVPPL